ncbi:uncharacterized protein [Haliotis cracherodii]|uniref:uncharacterized protein n=1 Tax=Haliotis cracherodii TaxID=6455 RepID=UPI0039E95B95
MDAGLHYTNEDIRNIPNMLRDLDVQDIQADADCLPLQERCALCFVQGRGDPKHREFRQMSRRRESFGGIGVGGHSPLYLSETGLFRSQTGSLTCFQCGQVLKVMAGEDPLYKHVDLYRNCSHACRMLGRRPRSGTDVPAPPSMITVAARRRLFSE